MDAQAAVRAPTRQDKPRYEVVRDLLMATLQSAGGSLTSRYDWEVKDEPLMVMSPSISTLGSSSRPQSPAVFSAAAETATTDVEHAGHGRSADSASPDRAAPGGAAVGAAGWPAMAAIDSGRDGNSAHQTRPPFFSAPATEPTAMVATPAPPEQAAQAATSRALPSQTTPTHDVGPVRVHARVRGARAGPPGAHGVAAYPLAKSSGLQVPGQPRSTVNLHDVSSVGIPASGAVVGVPHAQ